MFKPEIPILKRTIDLYKTCYSFRNFVSKQDRYSLWTKCEDKIIEILETIMSIPNREPAEKAKMLGSISLNLNVLRVFLRLAKEIKSLDNKKYIELQSIIDEIGRMLGGWIKNPNKQSTLV